MIPFRQFPARIRSQPGLPPLVVPGTERTTELTRKRKNPDDPSETIVTKTTIRPQHPGRDHRSQRRFP